jgi:hypothetical protein
MTSFRENEDSEALLPFVTIGNKTSPVLVFIAGFPDNCVTAWGENNLETLSKKYFVISLCYPGFAKKKTRKWGYEFDELIIM